MDALEGPAEEKRSGVSPISGAGGDSGRQRLMVPVAKPNSLLRAGGRRNTGRQRVFCHSTRSPCRLMSSPSRSWSSLTRNPTVMSITLSRMKLPTPL